MGIQRNKQHQVKISISKAKRRTSDIANNVTKVRRRTRFKQGHATDKVTAKSLRTLALLSDSYSKLLSQIAL